MDLTKHLKITLGKLLDIRQDTGKREFEISPQQLAELLEDDSFKVCLRACVENGAVFSMEVVGLKITSPNKAVV